MHPPCPRCPYCSLILWVGPWLTAAVFLRCPGPPGMVTLWMETWRVVAAQVQWWPWGQSKIVRILFRWLQKAWWMHQSVRGNHYESSQVLVEGRVLDEDAPISSTCSLQSRVLESTRGRRPHGWRRGMEIGSISQWWRNCRRLVWIKLWTNVSDMLYIYPTIFAPTGAQEVTLSAHPSFNHCSEKLSILEQSVYK